MFVTRVTLCRFSLKNSDKTFDSCSRTTITLNNNFICIVLILGSLTMDKRGTSVHGQDRLGKKRLADFSVDTLFGLVFLLCLPRFFPRYPSSPSIWLFYFFGLTGKVILPMETATIMTLSHMPMQVISVK